MAFDFPASPSTGQTYSVAGIVYVFDGVAWSIASTPQSIKTADTFNRWVNGGFQVSQENGNTGGGTSGYYPADQTQLLFAGVTPSTQRIATTNPLLGPYYVYMSSSLKASLATGDYMLMRQAIEGNRTADLYWGTAGAKPIVLRLNASASVAGTYCLSIRNGAGDRSYITPLPLTTTPTPYSFAIPGDTSGTWAADNTNGLNIGIGGAVGTAFQTAPGQWTAGNFFGMTGMSNLCSAAGQSISFSQVGLYADPLATGIAPPWGAPDYADELLRCMRYWRYQSTIISGYNASGGLVYSNIQIVPEMRTVPTSAVSGTPSYSNASGFSTNSTTYSNLQMKLTITATGLGWGVGALAMNARM